MSLKLSVLIPVWNQEELVIRALDSIPRRDDIEVLVRDDSSDDGTLAAVRQYKKNNSDLNLKVFSNRSNKGFGYTVNKLVASATGEYIYIMDSDDFLYTEKFNYVVDHLTGEYDVVYVNCCFLYNSVQLSLNSVYLNYPVRSFMILSSH